MQRKRMKTKTRKAKKKNRIHPDNKKEVQRESQEEKTASSSRVKRENLHQKSEEECNNMEVDSAPQRDAENPWKRLLVQMQNSAKDHDSNQCSKSDHINRKGKVGSMGGSRVGITCKWGIIGKSKGDIARWNQRKSKGKVKINEGQLGDNHSKLRADPKPQIQTSIKKFFKARAPDQFSPEEEC